jgi:hypothetical protein
MHLGEIVSQRSVNVFGPLALTALAIRLQVAPTTLRTLLAGKYPGEISGRKAISGRVETLARICTVLHIDIPSSLEICGLPQNDVWIAKGAANTKPQFVSLGDLESLKQILAVTGPMPVAMFLRNLTLVQEKRAQPTE